MGAIATPIWQFINHSVRLLSTKNVIKWPVQGGCSYMHVVLEQ